MSSSAPILEGLNSAYEKSKKLVEEIDDMHKTLVGIGNEIGVFFKAKVGADVRIGALLERAKPIITKMNMTFPKFLSEYRNFQF